MFPVPVLAQYSSCPADHGRAPVPTWHGARRSAKPLPGTRACISARSVVLARRDAVFHSPRLRRIAFLRTGCVRSGSLAPSPCRRRAPPREPWRWRAVGHGQGRRYGTVIACDRLPSIWSVRFREDRSASLSASCPDGRSEALDRVVTSFRRGAQADPVSRGPQQPGGVRVPGRVSATG